MSKKSGFLANWINSKAFEILCLLFLISPLVWIFHWSHARDSAVYIQGGASLLEGVNPYNSSIFRGGPFGSALFSMVFSPFSSSTQSYLLLVMNIAGCWIFVRNLRKWNLETFLIITLVVWSSSSRTSLDTNQLTGIGIGLLALVDHLLSKFQFTRAKLIAACLLSIPTAALLDMKPHFFLPIVLLIIMKEGRRLFRVMTIFSWIVGSLWVDLLYGGFAQLEWLRLVLNLGEKQNYKNFEGAAHNIWQFITLFIGSENRAVSLLPYVLYFGILFWFVKVRVEFESQKSIFLAYLIPMVTSYSHYYDMIPLVALSYLFLFERNFRNKLHFAICLFLTVPQNWSGFKGLLLLIFAVFINILIYFRISHFKDDGRNPRKELPHLLFSGLACYALVQVLNSYVISDKALIDALTTTETATIFVVIFLWYRRETEVRNYQ